MHSRILIGLALVASLVQGGEVGSVSLTGGASGTRIRFETGAELLSRIVPTSTGIRIDLLGATSTLKGIHPLEGNPLFEEVRCAPVLTSQARLTRFEFVVKPGVGVPTILHREWNGRDLDFILDRKPVSKPFAVVWTGSQVPAATMASLETSANLLEARVSAQGDLETIHLLFSEPPTKALLSGSGSKFQIGLGKARITSRLSGLGGSGLLLSGLTSTKQNGETALGLALASAPRSILLSRSGAVVEIRIVRPAPIEGVVSWSSKTGKAQQLIRSSLPADEVASLGGASKGSPSTGATFTPEGSQAAFNAQVEASNVATGSTGNVVEAERLEAERRKSREFVLEQERQADAKQTVQDEKNRVVYNTFGIRDPFIPLEPDDVEGGLNIDQMKVVGIIYSTTRPMAVLEHVTQSGLSVALREGDAIQNGRVLQILRDRVVFVLEEFGVTRQFTLKLQVPKGEKS